jgi:2-polyprenyl-3-methyl-5-hydroxy-6-metoxy-1,4-benzoquinol methylase
MEPARPDDPNGGHDREDWVALNRAAWDERVPLHVASDFYDTAAFLAGRSSLRPFEIDEVGPVAGKSLVHLQCHFGQDTLSWARLGATVTGLDFSPAAIDAARSLADRAGLVGEFVVANVYDAVGALGGRQFDVVYTGFGALVWLPDIVEWARVVAALVKPGGFLYLGEMHPFTDTFADDTLTAVHDYFTKPGGSRYDEAGTYADWDAATTANVTYEWTHPLGSVASALLGAGLRLELLHEYDFTLFQRWPFLERHDDGTYWLPAGMPRLPLIYTLRASKPPNTATRE